MLLYAVVVGVSVVMGVGKNVQRRTAQLRCRKITNQRAYEQNIFILSFSVVLFVFGVLVGWCV